MGHRRHRQRRLRPQHPTTQHRSYRTQRHPRPVDANNTNTASARVVPPPVEPQSTGYWKHNCTRDLLPQTLGSWNLTACDDAVDILDKRDTRGHKRANDGAYKLASQLLAAQLNLDSDAVSCPAVERAVTAGDQLLHRIRFNGEGSYLGPRTSHRSLRKEAIKLAEVLDDYNNGELC